MLRIEIDGKWELEDLIEVLKGVASLPERKLIGVRTIGGERPKNGEAA
jgi:hypothetical protein